MKIKDKVLKALWASSGGVCAFPGCNQELIYNKDVIGQICHIVAQSPKGPRGDVTLSKAKLDDYDNLILLCPTHHDVIDKDTDTYTVDYLHELKCKHEENIKKQLYIGTPWEVSFSQLYYINIPRIAILAGLNGIRINLDFLQKVTCLHELGYELNDLMLQISKTINDISICAVNMNSGVGELKTGQTIEFNNKFRTKKLPSIDSVITGTFKMNGDMSHDPSIYLKKDEYTLILNIDPRWLTTCTSFVNFSNGWVDVSGLAMIKSINDKEIVASPYVLGVPKSPLDCIVGS